MSKRDKVEISRPKKLNPKSIETSFDSLFSGQIESGIKTQVDLEDPTKNSDRSSHLIVEPAETIEKRKSDSFESDEFEQMLLNQGIISVNEFKQTIKLLEPSEQEFDKILEETCKDFAKTSTKSDIVLTKRDAESKDVVMFNQHQQKLTLSEIEGLEKIIKTQAIKEPASKVERNVGNQEPKPKICKFEDLNKKFQKSNDEELRFIYSKVPIKSVTPKTQTRSQSFEVKPQITQNKVDGKREKSTVTFYQQNEEKLRPVEIKKMENILKARGTEEKAVESLSQKRLEKPKGFIETKQTLRIVESHETQPESDKLSQMPTLRYGDAIHHYKSEGDIFQSTEFQAFPKPQKAKEYLQRTREGLDSFSPTITKSRPLKIINDAKSNITETHYERRVIIKKSEIELIPDNQLPKLGARHSAPSLLASVTMTPIGVDAIEKKEKSELVFRKLNNKENSRKMFLNDGIIHSKECNSYCNYAKNLKEDGSELVNHLRTLNLVESSKTRRNQSANSSIDDLINKLNQCDVESWLPKSSRYDKSKTSLLDKEHSRSLNDLMSTKSIRIKSESALRKLPTPSLDSTIEVIPSKSFGHRKTESLSKSVLDLTKVGLPKIQNDPIGGIEEESDKEEIEKPKIQLSIHNIDPSRAEIKISNITKKSIDLPSAYDFSHRRSSEVFGQRADASPYVEDTVAFSKPKTLSLQSLNSDKKRQNFYEKYEKMQSLECLTENREIGSDPECSRHKAKFGLRGLRHENLYSPLKEKPLMESDSSSVLSINRLYVRTPYEQEFRDLTKPKKPKSILKKSSAFEPHFESISLVTLPYDDDQKSTADSFAKSSLKESRSCGQVNSAFEQPEVFSDSSSGELKRTLRTSQLSGWNKNAIPSKSSLKSPQNSYLSSSESQFDSDSSRMSALGSIFSGSANAADRTSKPMKPRVNWPKYDVTEDEFADLSEIDGCHVQSDDSEFADRGFGYFYREKSKSD